MKKMFFAVLAIGSFVVTNAQSTDNSDAQLNVTVVKTVEISPAEGNVSFAVKFDKPGQFGKLQPMNDNKVKTWVINSTDEGYYTVSFDRGTIPADVAVKYDLMELLTLTPVKNQEDIGTGISSRDFPAGAGFGLAVKLYANVPWGVKAGKYAGSMTITATLN